MTRTFERFAGWCALLVALASVVFTIAFSVVVEEAEREAVWVSFTTLTVAGLVTVPVIVALWARLGTAEPQFALVALAVGLAGVIGSSVHGAYEIGVLSKPGKPDLSALPNFADPRGFLTFAVTGLALILFGWLAWDGGFPRRVAQLAVAAGVLLVVLYIGRITVLEPKTNFIKVVALTSGLVVSPAFYLSLARSLLHESRARVA
ncbi:MAG: hypothetical protein ACT4PI_02910 [Actinomycetota bacterium]